MRPQLLWIAAALCTCRVLVVKGVRCIIRHSCCVVCMVCAWCVLFWLLPYVRAEENRARLYFWVLLVYIGCQLAKVPGLVALVLLAYSRMGWTSLLAWASDGVGSYIPAATRGGWRLLCDEGTSGSVGVRGGIMRVEQWCSLSRPVTGSGTDGARCG